MKAEGFNILFTTANFPYPLIGGERLKQFNVIKHLSKKNKIFLLSFDKSLPVRDSDIEYIKSLGVDVNLIRMNKLKSYSNAAISAAAGKSLEAGFFKDSRYNKILLEILDKHKIDLIINFFLRTADYVKDLAIPKILMLDDCRSSYQRNTSFVSTNLKEKLIRKFESNRLKKFEIELLSKFDITTVVTEEDKSELKKLKENSFIEILTHGVYADYQPIEQKKNCFLFLGKLDVWTNIIMIDRLVNRIMPLILKKNNNLKLLIAGANPGKKLLNLKSKNISVLPNPEDIRSLFSNSLAFLHPHVGGSGIQNKALEAMGYGCPIITTISGARGINIENYHNGFISENDEEFAGYALEVAANARLARQIAVNAKEYVIQKHDWQKIMNKLDDLISTCLFNFANSKK